MSLKNSIVYRNHERATWCEGCGDYGVLNALCEALDRSGMDPIRTVLVTDNGCSSMIGFLTNAHSIHGLYGKALPIAVGVKSADPALKVIAVAGDGGAYAAGVGHLIHLAPRNPDVVYLILDNGCYGLTKGQPSPTANDRFGSPVNGRSRFLDPLVLLITAGATFVARGYSQDPSSLAGLIQEALNHRGFAVVHIVSPCPVFNPGSLLSRSDSEGTPMEPVSHPAQDRLEAFRLIAMEEKKQRVGIFYREDRAAFPVRAGETMPDGLRELENMMNTLRP